MRPTGFSGNASRAVACCVVALWLVPVATQELPRPKKKGAEAPAPAGRGVRPGNAAPATELVLSSDIDARIRIDGGPEIALQADDVKTMTVSSGEHLITFVSADRALRRQSALSAPAGKRTIATFSAAGELEDARADRDRTARERHEVDVVTARAGRFASMPWIRIPAGAVMVGCFPGDERCLAEERPARSAAVDAFEMMATEVSVSQFEAFAHATQTALVPQPVWSTRPDMPVVGISWPIARAVCAWMSGRLPTEAEWEHAARSGGGTIYPWGNTFALGAANLSGRSEADEWVFAAPVGSFAASASGLYDLTGNVWEWTEDQQGGMRVIKGGSWASPPAAARISVRGRIAPTSSDETVGCRCVRKAR